MEKGLIRRIALGMALTGALAANSADVEQRAETLVDAMTLVEQIQLLRPLAATSFQFAPGANTFPETLRKPLPEGAIGSAGLLPPARSCSSPRTISIWPTVS